MIRKYFYIFISILFGIILGLISMFFLMNKVAHKAGEQLIQAEQLYFDALVCREVESSIQSFENLLLLYNKIIRIESEAPTELKKVNYRDLLQIEIHKIKKKMDRFDDSQKHRASELLKESDEVLSKIEFYLE